MREERRREKREGRKHERLLAFFDEIIRSYGLNHKTFAEKAGMTPQAVHWIMSVEDDCALSKLEYMAKALGLEVRLMLKPLPRTRRRFRLKRTEWIHDGVEISVEGKWDSADLANPRQRIPSYVASYPEGGRLNWLSNFFKEDGLSLAQLSELTGINQARIWYWFNTDDIRISQIRDIAKATGRKMVWSFTA